ncbi:type II toxin-antitoxin system RelE/ParE family toxin [Mycobacterium sp.]|uniref:type II toxin-antitoxin system RelE family toxin n=1 Tax=Mycobacterium sp. TaxID=1785 RepID=UPI0031DFBAD7
MTDDRRAWSVQLSPGAIRALDELPPKVATAVVEFITGTLPTNPRQISKPLRYELSGWHVARRGDYRVTFRILDDDHVVLIGRIEHRAHVYRRR